MLDEARSKLVGLGSRDDAAGRDVARHGEFSAGFNRDVVLDRGEAVGMGTHEELMKNCDVYKEIALSQLSAAELA